PGQYATSGARQASRSLLLPASRGHHCVGFTVRNTSTSDLAHWSSIPYNTGMNKKRLSFSNELRQAVDASGLSRYRIAKELDVSESLLSRFMSGMWLGKKTMDALAELLDLHVSVGGRGEEAPAAEGEAQRPPKRKGKTGPEK